MVASEAVIDEQGDARQLPLATPSSPASCNDLAHEHYCFFANALRNDVLRHLRAVGLIDEDNNPQPAGITKQSIRDHHSLQRADFHRHEHLMTARKWRNLLSNFADGAEVRPEAIDPEVILVESGKESAELFRFATLLWSVPVSRGFGRRMRFIVRDRSNGKLIGLFALGDPVFNLRARDQWIGWDVHARRSRLVSIMDAYVVGAVPPYSQLLGGKLITSLIGSAEVVDAFNTRYGSTTGIISGEKKEARLAVVTVTSALGRSSLYNRVKLQVSMEEANQTAQLELKRIGMTQGYGHFQLSNELFERLRRLLAFTSHTYANGHQFGQGPNWRMRVARVGLKQLGLNDELLRHGIAREVYAMPLAENSHEYLRGQDTELRQTRPKVDDIATAALQRWILPRAVRCPEYQAVRKDTLFTL